MFRFEELAKLNRPMKVCEIELPVYISDYGTFLVKFDEHDWVEATTYSELKQKTETVIKARNKNIAIPVCLFTPRNGFILGTIRGVHGANGNFLVTWDDGRKEQISKSSDFYEVPSEEYQKETTALVQQMEQVLSQLRDVPATLTKITGKEVMERVIKALSQHETRSYEQAVTNEDGSVTIEGRTDETHNTSR